MENQLPTVKPDLPSGVRDLLPADAIALQSVVVRIARVYESFGFVPIETPCLQRFGVLTGGDPKFNKSIFRAQVVRGAEDKGVALSELGDDDTALRFDLTVSLARVVAAYTDLPRPFKRYEIGRVFRGEQAQANRYREFTQFDFDTIGSNSILADVECLQVMYAVMSALGIENFVMRFNTRKVLNGLAEFVGCKNAKEMFRIIDKLDRVGLKGVLTELQRQPVNKWDEGALAMTDEQAAKIAAFIGIRSASSADTLGELRSFFGEENETASTGIAELEAMVKNLKALGIPERCWAVDLSVARGLDYYTGPVFETYLTDVPGLGSVLSGGRFDGLTSRFIAGSNIAGVGGSVGIDRMITGMRQLGLLPEAKSVTTLLVTVFPDSAELAERSMQFAQTARSKGIKAEIYLGQDTTLRGQLAYARKQDVPYVVVVGPDEAASGKVQLKVMASRIQTALTEQEVFDTISQ